MIHLELSEEIIESHRIYLRKKLPDMISDFKKTWKKQSYTTAHKKFCDWLMGQVNLLGESNYKKSIFLQKPEQFQNTYNYIKNYHPKIIELINAPTKKKKDGTKEKSYSEYMQDALGYKKFCDKTPSPKAGHRYMVGEYKGDADEWCAYAYIMSTGLKVCPYCNRSYITSYYSEKNKVRPDLDHFFPKSIYPFFSMSIYNLVPSCKVCNSSFKGQKDFSFDSYINPYEEAMKDELMKFNYNVSSLTGILGLEEEKLELTIDYDKENEDAKRLKNNNEVFNIELLYQYHRDTVCELLRRQYIFNEEYRGTVLKGYEDLFADEKEMDELLFGLAKDGDTKNTLLGKLRKDIYEEFNSSVGRDVSDRRSYE